jgi:hypothetical protein
VTPRRPPSRTPAAQALGRVCLLALAALVPVACARTTTLSGCIVTSTPAGDQKPAAGALVMVVAGSDEFEQTWRALVDGFRADYGRTRAAYEQARAAERAARIAERHASRALARASRSAPSERYTLQEDPETGTRLWTNQQPPPPLWPAAQARRDASRRVADAGAQLNALIDLHLARAVEAFKTHHTRALRADAAGCFSIQVAAGTAYVFANDADRYWFREIDARGAPKRLDLRPANSGWPFVAAARAG